MKTGTQFLSNYYLPSNTLDGSEWRGGMKTNVEGGERKSAQCNHWQVSNISSDTRHGHVNIPDYLETWPGEWFPDHTWNEVNIKE